MAKIFHLTDENVNYFEYMAQANAAANADKNSCNNKLKRITKLMMDTELTERQRYCIVEHLMNGRKQKDIAKEMNVNESTVCRHIAAGKRKLHRAVEYMM